MADILNEYSGESSDESAGVAESSDESAGMADSAGPEPIDYELEILSGIWADAFYGDYQAVVQQVREGFDPSVPDKYGVTLLHLAARGGHFQIVKMLVEHGVNINAQTSGRGYTPLHIAEYREQYEVVQFLLENGADVTLEDKKGETALHKHLAHGEGHLELVKMLVECGANVNAQSSDRGSTPLHIAVCREQSDVVQYLLEKGADPILKDKKGECAVFKARNLEKCDIFRVLIRFDPEKVND